MDGRHETEFLKIYDDFADRVFRHAYFRVSDREKAKDITQETFLKFFEYTRDHDDIHNTKALLFRIVNNLIIDSYRKKKEESLDVLQEEGFDVGNDDHEAIMNMIADKELIALLEQLNSRVRDAIVMRYIDDMSPQEIAQITAETENTVSVRIHRGLRKLRQIIEHHYSS